jgi:small subunit ribosomal protein S16
VAVKIKLKRLGKIRAPYYRIVVADARTKRDGRAIEEIGKYHPKAEPSLIEVDSERAQHWLSVGAQPTDPVRKILEVTGDWQKFKGLAGTEGTLRTAGPKEDKKVAFAAAVAESLQESGTKTTRGRGRASDAKAGDGKGADAKAAGAKAGDGKGADAKAAGAKAGDGKGADAKAAGAKAGDGKAADAKASRPDRPARARKSDAAAKDASAAKQPGAAADPGAGASKAVAAEAPAADAPASDAPAAEAPAAEAPAAEAPAASADEANAEAEPAAEGGTESAGDGA